MKIKYVLAREILDSRGIPTVSTLLQFEDGTTAKGDVPSGASTGKNEVLELRDGDVRRYRGKGVLTAVDNINNLIAPQIIGKEFNTQEEFDKFLIQLDGTESKTNLGGNSILSLSMAFCKQHQYQRIPLYDHFARMYWEKDMTNRSWSYQNQ
jgi:enolase